MSRDSMDEWVRRSRCEPMPLDIFRSIYQFKVEDFMNEDPKSTALSIQKWFKSEYDVVIELQHVQEARAAVLCEQELPVLSRSGLSELDAELDQWLLETPTITATAVRRRIIAEKSVTVALLEASNWLCFRRRISGCAFLGRDELPAARMEEQVRRNNAITADDLQTYLIDEHRSYADMSVLKWWLSKCKLRSRVLPTIVNFWRAENRRSFTSALFPNRPPARAMDESLTPFMFWVVFLSWTACEVCGHRATTSHYVPQYEEMRWRLPHVEKFPVTCSSTACAKRQCSLSCGELEAGVQRRVTTHRTYVMPRIEDWPVFDPQQEKYIDYDRDRPDLESLLNLSFEESQHLSVVRIYVTKVKEYGKLKRGATFNWKKLKVCRGEWRTIKDGNLRRLALVDDGGLTIKSKAAYNWLLTILGAFIRQSYRNLFFLFLSLSLSLSLCLVFLVIIF